MSNHPSGKRRSNVPARGLPKVTGSDIELGNFLFGAASQGDTCYEAARALLREIPGQEAEQDISPAPHTSYGVGAIPSLATHAAAPTSEQYSQDWGRKFLPSNGGCVYIDLGHLEVCTPETLSAREYVAYWHALLRLANEARLAANEKRPPGQQIQVLANNSDGHSHSYGSHQNFLLTRAAWDNIFLRKPHYLLWLASFQVSSIIFTGQGKVGSENNRPPVDFQLSQRADFFETLVGVQTTYRRPIVNARDESLAQSETQARLHVIFYDSNLAHVANYLKVGTLQIILTMLEAECVSPQWLLDDPLQALQQWSHDPSLQTSAPLISGVLVTALELQWRFLEQAKHFVDTGGCQGLVPEAEYILSYWEDTLNKLQVGDFKALAARLDWVLKYRILSSLLERHPQLNWQSPQLKHLDHLYASIDPTAGLYWAYARDGRQESLVSAAEIELAYHHPPTTTRAWTRAQLLRAAHTPAIRIDWDEIRFRLPHTNLDYTLRMDNPLAFTQADTKRIPKEASLAGRLQALGATVTAPQAASPKTYPPAYNGQWTVPMAAIQQPSLFPHNVPTDHQPGEQQHETT